jgi:hypothetical protein
MVSNVARQQCLGRSTHLHGVLVLAGEGVDCSLLDTLLTLRKALVPERRVLAVDSCEVW